jgi:hypothetical protein
VIAPETRLRLARVPLARILITEHQPRYPARVQHYVALLSDPVNANADPGVIALKPHSDERLAALGYYELLDGHHRVLASHIMGRVDLLALIHYAPGQAGYAECAESAPAA